jgi:hypothetical protein
VPACALFLVDPALAHIRKGRIGALGNLASPFQGSRSTPRCGSDMAVSPRRAATRQRHRCALCQVIRSNSLSTINPD